MAEQEAQQLQEIREKLELLRLSYTEVLDATKHQDDKIGRFLAAVAFLIGGAVAAGTRTELVATRYAVDGTRWAMPLPGYLLVLFFVVIVITLLLLVSG